MQQDDTEMYSLEMSFSGILRVYNDEGVVRGEDAPLQDIHSWRHTNTAESIWDFQRGDFMNSWCDSD